MRKHALIKGQAHLSVPHCFPQRNVEIHITSVRTAGARDEIRTRKISTKKNCKFCDSQKHVGQLLRRHVTTERG